MFRRFVGIPRTRRTIVFGYVQFFCSRAPAMIGIHVQNVSGFCWDHPLTIVQNIKHVSEQKCVFFYQQTMDFCPKTNVFGQRSIICTQLNA
jgi:hypothetical protein